MARRKAKRFGWTKVQHREVASWNLKAVREKARLLRELVRQKQCHRAITTLAEWAAVTGAWEINRRGAVGRRPFMKQKKPLLATHYTIMKLSNRVANACAHTKG